MLLWGFIINVFTCAFCGEYFASISPVKLLIGYLITAIIGICMSAFSENPFVSFIGYNLVVLPIGAVLSVTLQDVAKLTILMAFGATACMTCLMMIAATLKPQLFLSMGRILFMSLIFIIIIELLMIGFCGVSPTIIDFVVIALFCLYVGYDWAKAQEIPKTLDNAVDSVVGLYLDIVNIFIRLIDIMED